MINWVSLRVFSSSLPIPVRKVPRRQRQLFTAAHGRKTEDNEQKQ